jgi:EAL domain-containing protein (putative c-di-GMP-specific phosphodiesterase class I)
MQHNPQSALTLKKLLWADAPHSDLTGYIAALREAGYEVIATHLGEEAEAHLKSHRFAAVLVGPKFVEANSATSQMLAGLGPEVPVVLLGLGVGDNGSPAPGAFRPTLAYLNAPTTPTAFIDALGSILWPGAPRPPHSALAPSTATLTQAPYGLAEEFDVALASLYMAYQPIVDCAHNRLYGYEALVRGSPGNLASPPALLAAAESLGKLTDLSRQIRGQVASNLAALPPALSTTLVFVNLHAQDLLDPQLFSPEAPLSAFAYRIVLEITERTPLEEIPDVLVRIGRLRAMGYRIALDDLGAGYAGLSTFAQLEPEVVKLDMALVRQVEKSRTKRHIIASMVQLCEKLNIHVIAEGIETIAERDVLLALGCQLLQGYYFGRPNRELLPPTF